jgi:hypothetical protein
MNHKFILQNLNQHLSDIKFLKEKFPSIPFVLGETNSESVNIDMEAYEGVFGDTLWGVDYILYGMSIVSYYRPRSKKVVSNTDPILHEHYPNEPLPRHNLRICRMVSCPDDSGPTQNPTSLLFVSLHRRLTRYWISHPSPILQSRSRQILRLRRLRARYTVQVRLDQCRRYNTTALYARPL